MAEGSVWGSWVSWGCGWQKAGVGAAGSHGAVDVNVLVYMCARVRVCTYTQFLQLSPVLLPPVISFSTALLSACAFIATSVASPFSL